VPEHDDDLIEEQIYGVLVGYRADKDLTYAVLYGQFGSELFLERDEDMNWWSTVHRLPNGDEHTNEPRVLAQNPLIIAKAIAESNDRISEGINSLLAEEEGGEVT